MSQSKLKRVWQSMIEVPMLFVTLGVLVVLVFMSLPDMSAFAQYRIWIVAVLVLVTVVDTLIGMIADIKQGHVGLDVLAVVAIVSTLAVGEYWASWTVVLMIYSGSVIEAYAQGTAEHNLTALLSAAPHEAHRISRADHVNNATATADTTVHDVDASEIKIMDLLLIKPGETVPVDGVVMSERAVVNLSMINGEPLPQTVLNAQRVPSGAINDSDTFILRAIASAEDSQYQRILSLVKSAQESRPSSVRTADLLAVPFTVLAFFIAGISWFISGNPVRFTQVLVLATPCPLLIAAPVAYLGGTSRLAASGVLIKGQEILEQLTKVSDIFFDKTGTLTVKQPQVVNVERVHTTESTENTEGTENTKETVALSDNLMVAVAGAVESYSIHILALGIASAGAKARAQLNAQERATLNIDAISHVSERSGYGVSALVDGHVVKVGRQAFVIDEKDSLGFSKSGRLPQHNTRPSALSAAMPHQRTKEKVSAQSAFPPLPADMMAAYVSIDGVLVGRIVLRDITRAHAANTMSRLRELGVKSISMLTGDNSESAHRIASEVGIASENVHSSLLPENKQRILNNSRQNASGSLMMVGDGVNDAPVLAAADIGVALTDGSSSAASQTAHMVIMNDNLSLIPQSIEIARRTRLVMLQSVFLGLGLALAGMIVAAFGVVPAVVGAFGQEAIDVVSIVWALNAVRDKK
ncbi:heavy metal translocating P-type ATPase [Alloscardovia omnicolens]|uniref:heavy metal translocating P-type ATPase n=1 Tax=Alloscardovia omnicolens TaxID=419015 RepID=UPI003A6494B4